MSTLKSLPAIDPLRAALQQRVLGRPAGPLLGRRPTLRVTLLTLMLGLLLGTVAVISGAAFVSTRASFRELEDQYVAVVSRATAREVQAALIEPTVPALDELSSLALRGLLPLDDPDLLGEFLIARLRVQPQLDWLYYGDQATGRFVAASRQHDGTVVLTRSAPDVDGGRWASVAVSADGARTPLDLGARPGFDPRERPWYQQALASAGVTWTEPYQFYDGEMGVTAARAVREPATAAVRGVFAADLYLDEIAAYLATVAIGRTGRVFLLTDEGRLVAGPQPAAAEQMPPVVATALGALPRPLATLETNESSPVTVAHDGVRYVVVFTHSDLTSGLDWITATVVPEEEFLGPAQHNVRIAAGVGLGAFVLALFLAYHIAHRIARPLGTIATDLERVGQFQLSATPAPRSFIQEIGVVSDAVDRMKASLRSFGRYVPTELVRELLARGEEARLGGETRTLTIFFSDIENFTHLSEALPPAVVVQHLADYLDWMTATIRAHAGIVNQFVGDGIMAFWNAPQPVADHAAQACRAALHAQQGLRTLQAQWAAAGTPVFRTRIGLHTGEALVGNVGTRERFTYTAMGDTTNLASRLEGLNKQYGTQILASEAVRAAAGPDFEWRRLDRVAVVGRREETVVYELLGERDAVPDTILHARDLYEQALAAYFAGDFAAATAGFRAAAAAHPADKAAVVMEARAEHLTAHPPASGWNGVYVASNK